MSITDILSIINFGKIIKRAYVSKTFTKVVDSSVHSGELVEVSYGKCKDKVLYSLEDTWVLCKDPSGFGKDMQHYSILRFKQDNGGFEVWRYMCTSIYNKKAQPEVIEVADRRILNLLMDSEGPGKISQGIIDAAILLKDPDTDLKNHTFYELESNKSFTEAGLTTKISVAHEKMLEDAVNRIQLESGMSRTRLDPDKWSDLSDGKKEVMASTLKKACNGVPEEVSLRAFARGTDGQFKSTLPGYYKRLDRLVIDKKDSNE